MNIQSFGIRGLVLCALASVVATGAPRGDELDEGPRFSASGYKTSGRASHEWALELAGSEGVFYRQGKPEPLRSPESVSASRPEFLVYETENGEALTVRLTRMSCSARQPYKVFVTVEFDGSVYQGCGHLEESSAREGELPARSPAYGLKGSPGA